MTLTLSQNGLPMPFAHYLKQAGMQAGRQGMLFTK